MKGYRVFIFLCLCLPVVLWAHTNPVGMIEASSNQVIESLKSNKDQLKSDHRIIYQTIEKYLMPHVDVEGMSRSVLGRAVWAKATAVQKQAFKQAFTRLVIRTYANPLAEYSGETVQFTDKSRQDLEHDYTRVASVIHRPNGQKISVIYSLLLKQGEWKIYDISVEGISLLQSFRSQFAQLLTSSSIDAVLLKLSEPQKAE